jgi:hypothetical protein
VEQQGVHPAENTTAGQNNEDDEEPDENEIHSFLRAFTWLNTLELRGSAVRIGLKALKLDLSFVETDGAYPYSPKRAYYTRLWREERGRGGVRMEEGRISRATDEGGECAIESCIS